MKVVVRMSSADNNGNQIPENNTYDKKRSIAEISQLKKEQDIALREVDRRAKEAKRLIRKVCFICCLPDFFSRKLSFAHTS